MADQPRGDRCGADQAIAMQGRLREKSTGLKPLWKRVPGEAFKANFLAPRGDFPEGLADKNAVDGERLGRKS